MNELIPYSKQMINRYKVKVFPFFYDSKYLFGKFNILDILKNGLKSVFDE